NARKAACGAPALLPRPRPPDFQECRCEKENGRSAAETARARLARDPRAFRLTNQSTRHSDALARVAERRSWVPPVSTLSLNFPRGERGEMILGLDGEQAEYQKEHGTCPEKTLFYGQHLSTKDWRGRVQKANRR